MTKDFSREPMLDIYIFETNQLIDQLEQIVIGAEKNSGLQGRINEIFRIMHTIKGSSAMMLFDNISKIAHALEDVFYFLREETPPQVNYSGLVDIVLEVIDFIKTEVNKIETTGQSNGSGDEINAGIERFLGDLKQLNPTIRSAGEVTKTKNVPDRRPQLYLSSLQAKNRTDQLPYMVRVCFLDDCQMVDLRAFTLVHNLKAIATKVQHFPEDLINDSEAVGQIEEEGLTVYFLSALSEEQLTEYFKKDCFIKTIELSLADEQIEPLGSKGKLDITLDVGKTGPDGPGEAVPAKESTPLLNGNHGMISVGIAKLDLLMDLVGELVIAEAMVTENPELKDLPLEGFFKAARHLEKISTELQDVAMSLRMVPLSTTFHKMNRLIRDMGRKLKKDVVLEIVGEETEVDKNIIEHIGDPLMHIIRNAFDHGIEDQATRLAGDKPAQGHIVLEAKNAGGEVWITIKDDGRGLDKARILRKAADNGLLRKEPQDMTDQEIYGLIFLPGFSTQDKVTEFSGRGVGMDVVTKNVAMVGGSVHIDSIPGKGATVIIKIPLTLAIIDGMNIRIAESIYTIPTPSIRESFRATTEQVITDPDGNEMIMIRGICYPILRLHRRFKIDNAREVIPEGIVVMVEDNDQSLCLFADELLGQQQVVVKALPKYLKKVSGVAGCTLLGSGSVSLIIDVSGLLTLYKH